MLIEAELVRTRISNFVCRVECFHPVSNAKTNSRLLDVWKPDTLQWGPVRDPIESFFQTDAKLNQSPTSTDV